VTPAAKRRAFWGKVFPVVAFVRRLTGLVLTLALVAGLPVAAARASCVCDHGHGLAATGQATPGAPHTCTGACTAETCPMHRHGGASAGHRDGHADRLADGMRCGCAGEAQALLSQATPAGLLPARLTVHAPLAARVSTPSADEAPSSLAGTPPAPPPRA
jgi:hypothetical protein